MSVERALLLAAGFGTRLRPLSESFPKPVWPFFDLPIAAHALHGLAGAGVGAVRVNLHHLGGRLVRELTPHLPPGMEVGWSPEATILGTGGALLPVAPFLGDDPFYLVNADTCRELDFAAMEAFHREKDGVATLLLAPMAKGKEGPIEIDASGRIVRFLEARAPGAGPGRPCDFAGVHLLTAEVLAAARGVGRESFCINADVHAPLVAAGRPLFGFLLPEGAWWSDLGTPERYLAAHRFFLDAGRLPPGVPGRLVGEGEAPGGGRVEGCAYFGPGALVEPGGVAGPGAVLGAGVRVVAGGRVEESVIWEGLWVGEKVERAIAAPEGVLRADGGAKG